MNEITRKEFLRRFALISAGSLLITGCPEYGAGPVPAYGVTPPEVEDDEPDETGNLIIRNNSDERLVLYADNRRLKIMPAYSSKRHWGGFVVDVPKASENEVKLILHVLDMVIWDLDNPYTRGHKEWTVDLPATSATSDALLWIVRSQNETLESQCGTLVFSNQLNENITVHIYINGRNGAKLTWLEGLQDRIIGIERGSYFLFFRYLNEDGELGWIDKQTVNGSEQPIYVILDDENDTISVNIPKWEQTA